MNTTPSAPRSLIRWLDLTCILILLMVLVGGVTRLTGSGLSMVTWEPILGAIPPRSAAEWQLRFEQYQAHPEFQIRNRTMTLPEFKAIYFWEYLHRLLGRMIGLIYALPLAWFFIRRIARGKLAGLLFLGLLLGGLQGVVGWWMVKSGLDKNPYVSPFRLAIHLGLALSLMSYLWWIRLSVSNYLRASAPMPLRRNALAFLALLCIQILYGALTAGLHAGLIYNTFPLMMGHVIPPGFLHMQPMWINFLENATTVQWIHRALAFLVLALALHIGWHGMPIAVTPMQRKAIRTIIWLTLLQFALGVSTLLFRVPVWLAVSHQVNASLLLITAVSLVFATPRHTAKSALLA